MKRASTWIIVLLVLIIAGLLTWIGYLMWWSPSAGAPQQTQTVNSFQTCVDAGNPVMESYPRQCRDETSGVTYTEEIAEQEPSTMTFTSPKGVKIEVDEWTDVRTVQSPLVVTGKVPGSWSFEASFPVVLKDAAGRVLAEKPAAIQGDWMTDELVPFTVTLTFSSQVENSFGTLELQRDNPSGLSENDDSVILPIRF